MCRFSSVYLSSLSYSLCTCCPFKLSQERSVSVGNVRRQDAFFFFCLDSCCTEGQHVYKPALGSATMALFNALWTSKCTFAFIYARYEGASPLSTSRSALLSNHAASHSTLQYHILLYFLCSCSTNCPVWPEH